jgi:hypothetical protein
MIYLIHSLPWRQPMAPRTDLYVRGALYDLPDTLSPVAATNGAMAKLDLWEFLKRVPACERKKLVGEFFSAQKKRAWSVLLFTTLRRITKSIWVDRKTVQTKDITHFQKQHIVKTHLYPWVEIRVKQSYKCVPRQVQCKPSVPYACCEARAKLCMFIPMLMPMLCSTQAPIFIQPQKLLIVPYGSEWCTINVSCEMNAVAWQMILFLHVTLSVHSIVSRTWMLTVKVVDLHVAFLCGGEH